MKERIENFHSKYSSIITLRAHMNIKHEQKRE